MAPSSTWWSSSGPSSKRSWAKEGWRHPGGIPLSEVQVGGECRGVVTNVVRDKVWIDFGAVKDGMLVDPHPRHNGKNFKRGEEVFGLRVLSCDLEKEKVGLSLQSENASLFAMGRPAGAVSSSGPAPRSAATTALRPGRSRSEPGASRRSQGSPQGVTAPGAYPAERPAGPSGTGGGRERGGPLGSRELQGGAGGSPSGRARSAGATRRRGDGGTAASDAAPLSRFRGSENQGPGPGPGRRARRPGTVEEPVAMAAPRWGAAEHGRRSSGLQSTRRGSSQDARRRPDEASALEQSEQQQRVPLLHLQVGSMVTGKVKNCNPKYGIFVDIGAQSDARLSRCTYLARSFRRGDVLEGLCIDRVDPLARDGRGEIEISVEDPEALLKKATSARSQGAMSSTRARGQGAGAVLEPAQPRGPGFDAFLKRSGPDSQALTPLEDLRVGSTVDGIVTSVQGDHIIADINCTKDAKLEVSRKLAHEFQCGDEVIGMTITKVDTVRGKIVVSLEDPELAVVEPTSQDQALPPWEVSNKSKDQVQLTRRPQGTASDRRGNGYGRLNFEIGDLVNGVVTEIMASRVYVDVKEAEGMDAWFEVSWDMAQEFRVGDQVQGMQVKSFDRSSRQVMLFLEDPRLDVEEGLSFDHGQGSAETQRVPAHGAAGYKGAHRTGTAALSSARAALRTPLARLQAGMFVHGTVTKLGPGSTCVKVDFGAARDGELSVHWGDGGKLEVGDQVENMEIKHVDPDRGLVTLRLPYRLPNTPQDASDAAWSGAGVGEARTLGGGGGFRNSRSR